MPSDRTRSIALIGMMGSGKSTTGQLVAAKLGLPFVDNDEEIARRSGASAADLLRADPQRFRQLEADLITESLDREERIVLSVGGGAIEREASQEQLRSKAVVVWLRAGVEVLLDRVANERQQRPMLDGDPVAKMRELLVRREPMYRSLADHIIDVDDIDPEVASLRIVEVLS